MVEHDNGTLRTIAWSEICPWLAIFRTFRLAVSPSILLLAAVAIFLTTCGEALLLPRDSGDQVEVAAQPGGPAEEAAEEGQPAEADAEKSDRWCPWTAITRIVDDSTLIGSPATETEFSDRISRVPRDGFFSTWSEITRPVLRILDLKSSLSDVSRWFLYGLWSLAVWAFFGGAITRIAAVQLTCEQRVGLLAAMRYACSKWRAYFAAPLLPAVGIALMVIPVFLLSLFLKANVSVVVAGVLWPLLLVFGFLLALLALGLIFGWPLMWTTISTEGTDSFDALSRSYAYVFQRPLHYLFYAIVAILFGALGWLLVCNFAAAVVELTYWAASWACGAEKVQLIKQGDEALGSVGGFGAALILFWTGCVKLLAVGFLYSYFWTAASAIYLLLRRDVDATEMDEAFLDEDESEQSYGLPPLSTDETGAPVVADESNQASAGESSIVPPPEE